MRTAPLGEDDLAILTEILDEFIVARIKHYFLQGEAR
jgi:hypothetical protein